MRLHHPSTHRLRRHSHLHWQLTDQPEPARDAIFDNYSARESHLNVSAHSRSAVELSPEVSRLKFSVISFALLVSVCPFTVAANAPGGSPSQIPLVFEPNAGQTAPSVRYVARSREGSWFFTSQAITLATPRHGSLRLRFAGSPLNPELSGENLLSSRSNYLGPEHGAIQAKNYGSVHFQNVYRGIDVRFYGNDQHLEHDILVAPGADPHQFALQLEGAEALRLSADGRAEFQMGGATMQESAPVAWQWKGRQKIPVAARWQMESANILRIKLGKYDRTRRVIIDPVLAYSTHLGGTTAKDESMGTTFPASTAVYSVAVDPSGNMYVAGTTSAVNYPTTAGAYDRTVNYQGSYHADTLSQTGFVTKFNKSGTLVYSTFLHWAISNIAVDSSGEVYAAKYGNDSYMGPSAGYDDGIEVDKLSADGSSLLYAYAYGKTPSNAPPQCTNVSGDSYVSGIAADNSGHVWIAGTTANPCLIVSSNAYQKSFTASSDSGFVAELDSTKTGDASIVAASYLSGTTGDQIIAMALDGGGNVYVTGHVGSADFPHNAVFGSDTSGTVFVTKFNPSLSALVFSDLLNGVSYNKQDGKVTGVALDPSDNVYVTGMTSAAGFPTTSGAYRTAPVGIDGFVTEFNTNGNALAYSTFLGGSSTDEIWAIAVNNRGIAFVTGSTQSSDFPVTSGAFQKSLASGATNAFVTAINAGGGSLYYSSFLGGGSLTNAHAITLDPAWNAYVAGFTSDSNFPVSGNAYQKKLHGATDGFLSKVVIAGDLQASMTDSTSAVSRNANVTFYARVYNAGPDGSDNVVLKDPIAPGWAYAGISAGTADSCTAPKVGATSGAVVCNKKRLESGQSFSVTIYLQAVAASGSDIKNTISTSAQTQDLRQNNNKASLTVHVN